MSDSDKPPAIPPLRQEMIATAVTFLQNPKVRHSALNQKQNFLRKKGLTEYEIQISCEQAGVFTTDPNNSGNGDATIISIGQHQKNYVLQSETIFGRIKEVLSSVALISGLAYAVYLFYKRFIEPLIFGRKKKKDVAESLAEINQKFDENYEKINVELRQVRDEIRESPQTEKLSRDVQGFRTDLDAIKGLLLNRKQFASTPQTSAPSIPAWQLKSQQDRKNSENSEIDKTDHETGSGSGSSETEVVHIDQSHW